ncbi:MAG: HD domain-containing protein [Ignavibacteriaceae bacterium]
MLNQSALSSLNKGDPVDHFLLVGKAEIRLTRNQKEYLFLELSDKSTSLIAYMWDSFESVYQKIRTGAIVKVTGSMDDFQGTLQIRISSLRAANESDNVDITDFQSKSKHDPDKMQTELFDRIEKLSNPHLKTLMKNIFAGDDLKRFSTAPAGKSWHHGYIHGLLEHTLEIVKICDLVCDIHKELNRDLLICGALLHDFGKTEELSYDSAFTYTDKGKLLGHIVIGAMFVNEKINSLKDFPEDLRTCLLHLILSHQGKLEYASPVVPKTVEAIVLYQADELSAKTNAYKNAVAEVKEETGWTKFLNLISTELYSHGLHNSALPEEPNSLFD